jgi:HlyD family secretion protein
MNQTRKRLIGVVALLVLFVIVKSVFFSSNFLYAGTLEATKVDLSAQLQSSIAEVRPQEGDHVIAEQELIVLACEDYKVDALLAHHIFKRNQLMFARNAISQDTMDQIVNKRDEADVKLQWCAIKSPIYGTVLSRYHEPGEVISPGTKILTLANIRDIWAYIYVPQPEVAKLKVGMPLKAILPEMNNREFNGRIIKINSEAEFTPKNVQTRLERSRLVFGVKVSFLGSNEEEILKPGMTVEINLPEK